MSGAGGTELHYLDFGGSGQAVVLLAGAGNSAWIYRDFGQALAGEHRVVALTRRGHGESERPATGYDLATLDGDLERFLDHLQLPRVVLVGHSLAGAELTSFAARHPRRVAGLVYLDAAYDRSTQMAAMEAAPYAPPPPSEDDLASVEAMMAYVRRTRADLARYWTGAVEQDLRVSIETDDEHRARWRTAPIFAEYSRATTGAPPDYASIDAPILAIYAVEDEGYQLPADAPDELVAAQQRYERGPLAAWREQSIAQLRAARPTAEIVEMDAGHHLFLHRPAETLALLRRFLARLER